MRSPVASPLLLAAVSVGLLAHCTLAVDLEGLTGNDVGGSTPATSSSSTGGGGENGVGGGSPGGGPPIPLAPIWAQPFGDPSEDALFDVAVGPNDDIAVVGSFRDGLLFGPDQFITSSGLEDGFLARMNADGMIVDSFSAGGIARDAAKRVAFDSDGSVVVAGEFSSVFTLGSFDLAPTGAVESFVARVGPTGSFDWVKPSVGSDSNARVAVHALAVDSAGSSYLAGSLNGGAQFTSITLQSAGAEDGFIVKYNRLGNVVAAIPFGDAASQVIHDLLVAPDGALYVVGSLQGTISFNNGMQAQALDGTSDLFVAKMDTNLLTVWVEVIESKLTQSVGRISSDGAGGLLVTGHFTGSLVAGGMELVSGDGDDMFVTRFNGAGTVVDHRAYGGPRKQFGKAVTLLPNAGAYLAGDFNEVIDLGLGALDSAGDDDIFLARFNLDGSILAQRSWGDGAEQRAVAMAVDSSGALVMGGNFHGTLDFGPPVAPMTASGAEGDIFIAKFPP